MPDFTGTCVLLAFESHPRISLSVFLREPGKRWQNGWCHTGRRGL